VLEIVPVFEGAQESDPLVPFSVRKNETQYLFELRIGDQLFDGGDDFFLVVGTYFVKFRMLFHAGLLL
jgi:hypothetical protein